MEITDRQYQKHLDELPKIMFLGKEFKDEGDYWKTVDGNGYLKKPTKEEYQKQVEETNKFCKNVFWTPLNKL